MDWLTTIWTAFISLSLALSGVYFVRWLRSRELLTLLFVLLGVTIAFVAAFEIWMFRSTTVNEYGTAVRWFHVPIFVAFCLYLGIIHFSFNTGRLWLGLLACGLRFVSLIVNFVQAPNLNYVEISEIRTVRLLGEEVSTAIGIPSAWMILGQLALILMLVYLMDAAFSAWRRDRDTNSIILGAALGLLVVAGVFQGITVFWAFIEAPILGAPFFTGVALLLGVNAGAQMIRAEQLDEELKANRAKLEQASHAAALSELSGALAHEINQPLGVIMSNAEAAKLMLESGPVNGEELRDIVGDIIAADRRAASVIARLRALLKRGEPDLQTTEMQSVVDEALSYVASDFKSRGINLKVVGPGESPVVRADRILMVQAVLNLLSNARDALEANPDGEKKVEVGIGSDSRDVFVTIADNGPGLDGDPSSIFDAFVSTKKDGLGMGLAITRSVVEAHDGTIEVESQEGSGALFRLSIPRLSPLP